MKKYLGFLGCLILLAACNKNFDVGYKSPADIDLKAFASLLYQPFSTAQSYFQNNINTVIQINALNGDSSVQNVLAVVLNDSTAGAQLNLYILDSSGISVAYYIENELQDTSYSSSLQQNIANHLGNIASTTFGTATFCSESNGSGATNTFSNWSSMQQYISSLNGGYYLLQANWNYNSYNVMVRYQQTDVSYLVVSLFQNNTTTLFVPQNIQIEKARSIFHSSQ